MSTVISSSNLISKNNGTSDKTSASNYHWMDVIAGSNPVSDNDSNTTSNKLSESSQ